MLLSWGSGPPQAPTPIARAATPPRMQHGSWNRQRPIGARVTRVVLDPANPTRVQAHLPFLCGGVPGDTCKPTGPVPPVQQDAEYRGELREGEQRLAI